MIGHKSLVHECYHILYVDHGYRYSHDVYQAFLSLFTMHNETMNIWSHLIGFICVVVGGILTTIDVFSSQYYSSMELFALETYMLCAAICLLCSSIYHWFCCISENCHDWLLKLDLTGVALLIAGSFLPGAYYGFYCTPTAQAVQLGVTSIVLIIGLAAPWLDLQYKGKNLKPYVYAFLVVLGLIPFNHWLLITPARHRDSVVMGFIWLFFWYGTGFTAFVTKIPEVFFKNNYIATHIIPSHTIWHICVLNAVYVWYYHLLSYRQLIMTEGCSAYEQRCELHDCTSSASYLVSYLSR